MKITLLDYCSEKNRGDAAIQQSIIRHIKRINVCEPELNIITVFGNNEQNQMNEHFDHSLLMNVRLYGGIKSTFYTLKLFGIPNLFLTEILNIAGLLYAYIYIFLINIGIAPNIIKMLMTKKNANTFEVITNSDIVFLKGRNYRSRKNQMLELIRTASLLYNGFLASALNKKIILIGGSFWQLNNRISKLLIARLLQSCALISVRESFSDQIIREMLSSCASCKIRLIPDLGFSAFDVNFLKKLRDKKKGELRKRKKVGIVLVNWRNDGENIYKIYIDSVAKFIKREIDLGALIYFILQVSKEWESNDDPINILLSHFSLSQRRNIIYLINDYSIEELIRIYNNMDFVLTTRMHAAIFSVIVGTPVISISYDSGAKWSTLKDIGLTQYICPIGDVSLDSLDLMRDQLWVQLENRGKMTRELLEQYTKRIDRFFEESLLNS